MLYYKFCELLLNQQGPVLRFHQQPLHQLYWGCGCQLGYVKSEKGSE